MSYFIIIITAGFVGMMVTKKVQVRRSSGDIAELAVQKIREHNENKEQILGLLEGKERIVLRHVQRGERARITRSETERLLGVSDNVAERYLLDLERKGMITRVGQIDDDVYYERVQVRESSV